MPPDDAEWVRVDKTSSGEAEYPLRVRAGEQSLLIFMTPRGLRGVERHCPHQQALLTKATLLGNGTLLKCPLHNFIFRLTDGIAVNCPGFRLGVFDVKEEAGDLHVRRLP